MFQSILAAGDPIDFASISKFLIAAAAIPVLFTALYIFTKAKSGNIKEVANTILIVLMGFVVLAMGAGGLDLALTGGKFLEIAGIK